MSRAQTCTSSTRPESPNNGSVAFESDTNRLIIWNGSSWTPIQGSAAWSPSSLASLFAWYDASDSLKISKNASNEVLSWLDKSDNSNDLSAQGNPVTNSSTQNSLNVFDLDGDDYFEMASFSTPTDGNLQAFIVCKVDTVDNNADSIMSMDASSNDWQLNAGNASQFRGNMAFDGQEMGHTSTTPGSNSGLAGFRIFCVDLDFTNDGKYQLIVDGVTLAGTHVRNYTGKLASVVDLHIFANRQTNRFPEGQVAEVVMLNSTSDSDRQKTEGYLAHKWGLTSNLDASHPYKNSPPS